MNKMNVKIDSFGDANQALAEIWLEAKRYHGKIWFYSCSCALTVSSLIAIARSAIEAWMLSPASSSIENQQCPSKFPYGEADTVA